MSLGEAPVCVTPEGTRQRSNQKITAFWGPINNAIEATHSPKTYAVILGVSRQQQIVLENTEFKVRANETVTVTTDGHFDTVLANLYSRFKRETCLDAFQHPSHSSGA